MTSFSPPIIAHIIYALGTGGMENGLVNIINRIPPEKFRHVIICLTKADDFSQRIQVEGVRIIELDMKPGHDLGIYWRVWKTLRTLKPDIVHTRNLASLEMQVMSFLSSSAKRVHGEHGRDIYDLEGKNKKYNMLRKLVRPFIHHYVAVSRDLEHWLVSTINVDSWKIEQIYNGVDQAVFGEQHSRPALDMSEGFFSENMLVIGTVGRLAEVKDQGTLIEALNIIFLSAPELRNKLKLMIVGDGPLKNFLQQKIESYQLQDSVWLAGDRNNVPDFLSQMNIFVLPSLGEGVSNTILEAMATGLPIIATNVGGNPELVHEAENGLLISVGDPNSLADAIINLINDPNLRNRMGKASLNRIRNDFSWDNTVNRYMALYDSLLDSSSVPVFTRES